MSPIKIGSTLPDATLSEFIEEPTEGCTLGPNFFKVSELAKNKRILAFGVPGAFTPACSNEHAPGYIKHWSDFRAKGVDEIWCISVNDAFVMGAWSKTLGSAGKVRMLGDGNLDWTRKLGLEADMSAYGMGTRSQRYALFADKGVLKILRIDIAGRLDISKAETLLAEIPPK